MALAGGFEAILQQRLPLLQQMDEALQGRVPVIHTDLSRVGREITTPRCLQHVGEQIVEVAKADWTTVEGLRSPVVPYLTELVEFWEAVFRRHREAIEIFSASGDRSYCLLLRSFTGVTNPIEVPGARVVMFLNDPASDANVAATLVANAEWLNPVTCMHTDDLQLLARSGPAMPSFRVHTSNWQEILTEAIANSGSIIFYVDGESPGVNFELDQVRKHRLAPKTLIVHRGDQAPTFARSHRYGGVMPVGEFLDADDETGPGRLSEPAERLLRRLASKAARRTGPAERLLTMPCEIVDPGGAAVVDPGDPVTSYFVAESNAAAFVNYVVNFPESLLRWNAISQDMRLRGIQPHIDDFNALYLSLRMAFVSATCLGFTSSIASTIGLLAKVTSMVKQSPAENKARIKEYMRILDIGRRFDALTVQHAWAEKLEAFRTSHSRGPVHVGTALVGGGGIVRQRSSPREAGRCRLG